LVMASQCVSREINGIATEVVVQNYADRVLVLVTQLGKVGNLVRAPAQ
jgi:proteasome assembly chaperone 3